VTNQADTERGQLIIPPFTKTLLLTRHYTYTHQSLLLCSPSNLCLYFCPVILTPHSLCHAPLFSLNSTSPFSSSLLSKTHTISLLTLTTWLLLLLLLHFFFCPSPPFLQVTTLPSDLPSFHFSNAGSIFVSLNL